jgi:conserved oligomeric Golgi complex subunit 6
MRAHIAAANRETGPILEEATTHMMQKSQIETKQQLLAAFKKHFLISEEETSVLTSSSEPVDEAFFATVAKVKQIHSDSEFLLGTENERLGLDILEQSSKQLNAAFQKLYRWIQKEFKTLDLENPQIGRKMRRALRVLAERPQLFHSCMDSFSENREHILSDAFHAALTGTATNSDVVPTAKPIEFQAHDPLRYIGDMLAWAHSATVSEREALEVLFVGEGEELAKGLKTGREQDPWTRSEQPDGVEEETFVFDGRKALNDLVSRDIAGVGRLLRQRCEQVVTSHEDAALAYRIANLISFYKRTFAKLLSSEAAILDVLDKLEDFSYGQFEANMRDHVASIQSDLTHAPHDINPPEFLEEALETLKVLMKSFDSSMAAASGNSEAFSPILKEALDPFLSGCDKLATHLPPPQNSIFTLNCLLLTKSVLTPHAKFTSSRLVNLTDAINTCTYTLTSSQHAYFLSNSGLEPLISALSQLSDSPADLAKIPEIDVFSQDNLITISQELDDFLPSALMDAMEQLKGLRSLSLVRSITEEAAERFCEAFEGLEAKILAADELREREDEEEEEPGKPLLREFLPRTSGEIRVLLS